MSGEGDNWLDWRQFGRVEWAFVAGLVALVLAGAVYGVYYVSKADPPPLPPLTATARNNPSVSGFIVSASDTKVVVQLADGSRRTLAVRPEDLPNVGVPYLHAHAGDELSGFLVYYDSSGGTDYAMGAVETGPPPVVSSP